MRITGTFLSDFCILRGGSAFWEISVAHHIEFDDNVTTVRAVARGEVPFASRFLRKRLSIGFWLLFGLCLLLLLLISPPMMAQETISAVPEERGPMSGIEDGPRFDTGGVHRFSEPAPLPRTVKKVTRKNFSGYVRQRKYFTDLCTQLYADGRANIVSEIAGEHRAGTIGCSACKPFFRLLFSECRKAPGEYRKIEQQITALQRELRKAERNKNKTTAEDKEALLEGIPSLELNDETSTEKKRESVKKPEEGATEEESEEVTLEELLEKLPRKQLEPRLFVIESASRFAHALARDKKRLDDHLVAIQYFEKGLRSEVEKTEGEKLYLETLAAYIKSPFIDYERAYKRRKLRERLMSDQQRRNEMMRQAAEELGELSTESEPISEDLFYDPDHDIISFE